MSARECDCDVAHDIRRAARRPTRIGLIARDIIAEVERVDAIRGDDAETKDGTGPTNSRGISLELARGAYAWADAHGGGATWANALQEELCEAFCESDPARLRAELVQVAAVALRWIRAIDARGR